MQAQPQSRNTWKVGVILTVQLLLFGSIGISALVAQVAATVVLDDFRDNVINPNLWAPLQVGLGPTVAETSEQLEILIPSESQDDPSLRVFGAGYTSICLLRGDFDLQVNYQLLMWPFSNGVRVGLGAGSGDFLVAPGMERQPPIERVSFLQDFPGYPREVYLTDFEDGVRGITATQDLSGALRLVRSGSVVSGFFLSSGQWILIYSAASETSDFRFSLVAWSHDYAFADLEVKVALDDFVVNNGELVCPLSLVKYFTDADGVPLPSDTFGHPKVDVVLVNGRVQSTNPGQITAWVMMTNYAETSFQSLVANENLPVDWQISPDLAVAAGAIHVFFGFADGTVSDITQESAIAVSGDNPRSVTVHLPDITSIIGTSLSTGESIILSVKLTYGLMRTNQPASSYPRDYIDVASASAWSGLSFTGDRFSGSASTGFVAYAKILGDVDGNFLGDILDAGILVFSYATRPGVVNILDVAVLAFHYGQAS